MGFITYRRYSRLDLTMDGMDSQFPIRGHATLASLVSLVSVDGLKGLNDAWLPGAQITLGSDRV
jgi:hypothetical protein